MMNSEKDSNEIKPCPYLIYVPNMCGAFKFACECGCKLEGSIGSCTAQSECKVKMMAERTPKVNL